MKPSRASLQIINARENNLKGINLELPHDAMVGVTGLSGSGKSSLAFDTIYAEGQRRYIETFSPYTRQFFDKVKRPKVDLIENVRPAIAIQQRTRILNSRSTVGSMTDINDLLKIVWSNVAKPVCNLCGRELTRWSAGRLARRLSEIAALKPDATFLIGVRCVGLNTVENGDIATTPAAASLKLRAKAKGGATLSKAKKGDSSKGEQNGAASVLSLNSELERLKTLGFSRYIDPTTCEVTRFEDLPPDLNSISELIVVIDRFRHGNLSIKTLSDSIGQCFAISRNATVEVIEQRKRSYTPYARISVNGAFDPHSFLAHTRGIRLAHSYSFSERYQCGDTHVGVPTPRPALFSYNHPIGACGECNGFGKKLVIDAARCVPDPLKSIANYAVQCWSGAAASDEHRQLLNFCRQEGIATDIPWHKLSKESKDIIFNHRSRSYVGIYPWFEWLERKKYKMHVRVFLARYRTQVDCDVCAGTRFKSDSLLFRIRGLSIAEVSQVPFSQLLPWFEDLLSHLKRSVELARQLEDVFRSIIDRLTYLVRLGLPYLTLDRQSRTLSGGETQRVNLVSALGSNLISTHFVLDEPSVGLHPRDTEALIAALRELTDRGNSTTIVEHDLECLNSADYIVELGPLAGEQGGDVKFFGARGDWEGVGAAPYTLNSAPPKGELTLAIRGACARNLKGLNIDIPLNAFVVITGVSGSGKSSLISQVIVPGYEGYQRGGIAIEGAELDYREVSGFNNLSQAVIVDQSPLAKTPRANIATYTKIWDCVRDILAATDDARLRGLNRSSFSFNVSGGRCATCEGAGFIREDMQFLSDVFIECEACLGSRFQAAVLEVRYSGLNVHDILSLSVERASQIFSNVPQIVAASELLIKLGLGHLTLGHPLSELSGGEAQRLKLVPHIVVGTKGPKVNNHFKGTLFLFDEPTTGLHIKDVERLLELFRFLIKSGHSIICVEHNLRLIADADWIIDLGPEGGELGGYLIEQGTPSDIVKRALSELSSKDRVATSLTAKFLAASVGALKALKAPKEAAKRRKVAPAKVALTRGAAIEIRGAKEHNLKSLSLDIPLGQIVALTGVSGSGKSTIAKDIIYAEGQRRYLDCLSPYARQFIKELKKPAIDDIRNIQPTICVYQHTFQPSALSTVATMCEVYNFLRLLYAKLGTQFCPDHPQVSVSPLSAEQIAAFIKENYSGSIRLLAPIIVSKKGHHRAVFQRALDGEIAEVRVDSVFSAPGRFIVDGLAKTKVHTIEFVTARCGVKTTSRELLVEGIKQALSLGGGSVLVVDSTGKERVFSSERTCQVCQRGFFKPDPEDLSFNSKRGRCKRCEGYGVVKGKLCSGCGGSRINEVGRNIRLLGYSIDQLCQLNSSGVFNALESLRGDRLFSDVANPILNELEGKLKTLRVLGLDHLLLNRECATLSNGELQRLRLATAIGSPLTGVTYIFDEPSAGLHPADNSRLLGTLSELRDRGNTVIQIEHELENILHSDQVIDIGPGAGVHGGELVFQGSVEELKRASYSATGRALCEPLVFNDLAIEGHTSKREAKEPCLLVKNAERNNLRGLSCALPLKKLVTVAGVSGAGKSSLVHGVIVDALVNRGDADRVVSSDIKIDRVLVVDQQPIGKTSRSTPASYLGIWDEVRAIFANTIEAKSRGWGAGFFSYNTGKGRCPSCKGAGELTLEMSFLAEARVVCESCSGRRFASESEAIRYRDLSPSQVLGLTFEQARTFFVNHRAIYQVATTACDLGLSYLTLGQPSSTLSGGESQRLKLASELNTARRGHTLYVLDEPTTGLHRADVALLLKALRSLVTAGHSVLVIEHDSDTISRSDWVLELGPGPGDAGGRVVFEGHPAALVSSATPWGAALRERIALHSELRRAAY